MSFTADELEILQAAFLDEANELLEGIAGDLTSSIRGAKNPSVTNSVLRAAHSLKGSAATVEFPELASFAHEFEEAVQSVSQAPWTRKTIDSLLSATDSMRGWVSDALDESLAAAHLDDARKHLVCVGSASTVPPERPAAILESQARLQPRGDRSIVRVDAAKLDDLIDRASQLLFDRARVEQWTEEIRRVATQLSAMTDDDDPRANLLSRLLRNTECLVESAGSLHGTVSALQSAVTQTRMMAASQLFERLAPQIRDAARTEGKRVSVSTDGGAIEFDKATADALFNPLIHLIRNAIAHGIEPAPLRGARGKHAQGAIQLVAAHRGDRLTIDVIDDGAGVDVVHLRALLVERGLWTSGHADQATDAEVTDMLFSPQFSSRDRANPVAGRGVGLDSVRAIVTELGGEVSMESRIHHWTRVRMDLPLSTAIAHAFLFEVSGNVFAVPRSAVVLTTHAPALGDSATALVQDIPVPLVHGHALLNLHFAPSTTQGDPCPVVVLSFSNRQVAISCTKLLGPRKVVVRPLGPILSRHPLLTGGTISGAGKIQLILDPAAMVRSVEHRFNRTQTKPAEEESRTAPAPRALIVDDSRTARVALATMLRELGIESDQADCADAAVKKFTLAYYSLLITDVEMPGMSGVDLVAQLRDQLHGVTVVVVSSQPPCAWEPQARNAGAHHCLAKPINPAGLKRLLGPPS